MTDDLITRLREDAHAPGVAPATALLAADRIEALEAEQEKSDAAFVQIHEELHARDAVIAEARRLNDQPAITADESRQKAKVIEVALSRVPQGAAEPSDEWCRDESCVHRNWRSGSMPTHKRGADCPQYDAEEGQPWLTTARSRSCSTSIDTRSSKRRATRLSPRRTG